MQTNTLHILKHFPNTCIFTWRFMRAGLALEVLACFSCLAAFSSTTLTLLVTCTLPANFLLCEEIGYISLPPFHTVVYIQNVSTNIMNSNMLFVLYQHHSGNNDMILCC